MGRTATGVRAMLLEDGDEVVDMVKIERGGQVLAVTERGMGKRTPEDQYPAHRRGGKGVWAMQLTDRTGDLACLRMAADDQDLMLIRDDGTVMRMPVDQVSVISRYTQGVRLMRVDEGTRIASVALVPHQEQTDGDEDGGEA